jgi:antitoxin ParD1/3/4
MEITLSPELEHLVQVKTKTGLYQSASDVICEALWLLDDRDHRYESGFDQLRHDIHQGLTALERGDTIPADDVFQELRRRGRSQSTA